ncbi:hypothetical protein H5410_060468 [Solanum commersonii]|uniref:Uncharacterized protein n=1 Tax=Solanum commersonii TaxID=4109 RepID=A0A9J5W6M8_SOLCO|nr:hypothetical protein H5410_060468 [Solanum commersonii]
MHMYLDSVSYTTPAYKYKMHYERILSVIGSGVMAPEEWGMSPFKERDYIEISIHWIMKWFVEVNNTPEGFAYLQRTFYTKFWNKLIQKDLEGKIHGQEIIDLINTTMDKYHNTERSKPQVDDLSPFKQIARKIQMKKGLISKSEVIAIYKEEVKRDLMKNLNIDIRDYISMASASHTNIDEELCMAREA